MEIRQAHEYSTLERLPLEVLDSIISQLALPDFQNLRLICHTLARASESHLAQKHFSGVPWRDDISRLKNLSDLSRCAPQIRSVKLNFARLDEYNAFHESFENLFLLEPEIRSRRLQEDWAHYFAMRPLQATVPSYTPCDVMTGICSQLPNLKKLCITWQECPWDGEEVQRAFKAEESIRLGMAQAVAVQKDLIRALWVSDAPLEELRIMPLVVGIDDVTEIFRLRMGTALQGLRSLHLAMPETDVNWGYIVPWLRQMTSLAVLHVLDGWGDSYRYDIKEMKEKGKDISEVFMATDDE